jgi:hypothetical protein
MGFLRDSVRDRIVQFVREATRPSSDAAGTAWSVMVVDHLACRILSAAVNLSDIVELGVTGAAP